MTPVTFQTPEGERKNRLFSSEATATVAHTLVQMAIYRMNK